MKKPLIILLLVLFVDEGSFQQCRQVTVCDEDVFNNNSGGNRQGEKGEVGASGKKGPPGMKGSKGEIGVKGTRGEPCALGMFEEEMRLALSEIKLALTPESCLASNQYGSQRLKNGEDAFCDGGWTVFQRRYDGSVDFQLNWVNYKTGFGNLTGEFWLGLENIHKLTREKGCRLRIDLWDFNDDHAYAQCSSFSVENEEDLYRLHVGDYSGTAGDSLTGDHVHNNMPFTTKDRDNDNHAINCAAHGDGYHGGWWHNSCYRSILNGPWGNNVKSWKHIIWNDWKGNNQPIKKTTMKLRCD